MKKKTLLIALCFCLIPLLLAGCSARSSHESPGSLGSGAPSSAYDSYVSESSAPTSDGGQYSQNQTSNIQPKPGVLTAGEWNDNLNFEFMQMLMSTHDDWRYFYNFWQMTPERRTTVNVTFSDGQPAANVSVDLLDQREKVVWTAVTDSTGTAYLFNGLKSQDDSRIASIRIETTIIDVESDMTDYHIVLDSPAPSSPLSLDFMLVIDTTGSMGDELDYLKEELEDVVLGIKSDNANLPIRLSVNVYRDIGDEYVVRSTPFSERIDKSISFLQKQYAEGGGDFEEAVEKALADAIYDHEWNPEATAKLLFLVLDAPPHNTKQNRSYIPELMSDAAAKGIRIIPIASSGIDKDTEFLLRTMSITTGGSYVFLTDHSGVGNTHLDPTIGNYEVEYLNELLVRLINSYL